MCTLLYVRMYVLFSCLATHIVVNKFNIFLFIQRFTDVTLVLCVCIFIQYPFRKFKFAPLYI